MGNVLFYTLSTHIQGIFTCCAGVFSLSLYNWCCALRQLFLIWAKSLLPTLIWKKPFANFDMKKSLLPTLIWIYCSSKKIFLRFLLYRLCIIIFGVLVSYYFLLFSFHKKKNLEKLKDNELSIFVQIIMESFYFCSLVEI